MVDVSQVFLVTDVVAGIVATTFSVPTPVTQIYSALNLSWRQHYHQNLYIMKASGPGSDSNRYCSLKPMSVTAPAPDTAELSVMPGSCNFPSCIDIKITAVVGKPCSLLLNTSSSPGVVCRSALHYRATYVAFRHVGTSTDPY